MSHDRAQRFFSTLLICGFVFTSTSFADDSTDKLWNFHVRPILNKNCVSCHGVTKKKSGLDLRSIEAILKGGDDGPAVVKGKPLKSSLYLYVLPGAEPHMPPGKDKQLTEEEIKILARWIERLNPDSNDTKSQAASKKNPSDLQLPLGTSPELAIDVFLERQWNKLKVTPTSRSSDPEFLRRLYLDLLGRIPTSVELHAFAKSTHSDKRNLEIDRLLNSKEFAKHFREIFSVVLMGRGNASRRNERQQQGWNRFLEDAFNENRSWKEVVKELVVARPKEDKAKGAIRFISERKNDAQKIAEALAPSLLGIQIQCAQCHDHPIAPEIEQRHYWGLVAFFNRSQVINTKKGQRISESAIGGFINFKTLSGDEKPAELIFYDAPLIQEMRPKKGEKEKDDTSKYIVAPPRKGVTPDSEAVPKFSRRQKLYDDVISEHPLLAKAFVNRVWAHLFGRGLVHPVDKIDSAHPPSHPDLFEFLAADFKASDFDVKRLIRSILKSRAYQLAGYRGSQAKRPRPEFFSAANEKPLSAEAYLRSIVIAVEQNEVPNLGSVSRSHLDNAFLSKFPELFQEEFSPTLKQALFMTNNPAIQEMLKPREGNLAWNLLQLKKPQQQVERAFEICLGRKPDQEELSYCVKFLEKKPKKGIEQLLWSIVSGAEFRLNH